MKKLNKVTNIWMLLGSVIVLFGSVYSIPSINQAYGLNNDVTVNKIESDAKVENKMLNECLNDAVCWNLLYNIFCPPGSNCVFGDLDPNLLPTFN
ncbi:MAG: hypothetical protein DA328_04085 [Nitrososphaeraceae archaeon]|nr:hypothetical protein [Nitrososphaeraceae archaeon]